MPNVEEQTVFLNEPGPPATCSTDGVMLAGAQINGKKAAGNSF